MSQPSTGQPFIAPVPEGVVVLAGRVEGYPVIATPTPLTRLNFFDGRFLRGEDLTAEAAAHRELVFASNQAGGDGVANGFEVTLADDDRLRVGAGLAIDPLGRVLLLTQTITVPVADLLEASTRRPSKPTRPRPRGGAEFDQCEVAGAEEPVVPVQGATLYRLTVGHVEGLCGSAEVFGRICEEACVTSTDRPYRIDGIVLRLHPFQPDAALPGSRAVPLDATHQRSRVAAAYFADERVERGELLSRPGLLAGTWCLGAPAPAGTEVPLAVLARAGTSTQFLDQWTARRERLDVPARAYWAGRLRMRPWTVFLAEVLQFQCHLSDVDGGAAGLVAAGIVELPPAGYLTVNPDADLDPQLRTMLGGGVDLRFLGLPADEIAHEFERAQHLDRIALLPGLENAAARAEVDVFVPDGQVTTVAGTDGLGFAVRARIGDRRKIDDLPFRGALRFRTGTGGGFTLAAAAVGRVSSRRAATDFVRAFTDAPRTERPFETLADTVPEPGRLPLSLSRIRLAADQARRFAAGRRAEPERRRAENLYALKAERAEAEPIAVRATLFSEREPHRLQQGQSTFVQGTVEIYAPSSPRLQSLELTGGTLLVLRASGSEAKRLLAARLTGLVRARTAEAGEDVTETDPLELDLSILLTRDGDQHRIEFLLRGETPLCTLVWSGSPISGEAELSQVVRVLFDEDPGIFSPSNESHQYAADALQILQGAHPGDPDYLDRTMAEQFGSDPGGRTRTVAATRDWVLFRRRRHETPTAPALASSRVVVWASTASDPDTAQRDTELLLAGRGSDVAWRRVRTVEFDAGSATAQTAAGELRAAYREAGGAEVLAFAGFGAGGAMRAGRARTEALARMLSPVAELAPGARVDEIPDPPQAFLEADTDGSVFLVSHPAPEQVTHRLRVLAMDRGGDDALVKQGREAIRAGAPDIVEDLVRRGGFAELGEVGFGAAGLDGGQADDVVAKARDVIGDRIVDDDTPLLWLDPRWAGEHPEDADALSARHVPELLAAFQDRLELRDRREVDLGMDRPAWLVLVHTKG